jgi:hypothetical protein
MTVLRAKRGATGSKCVTFRTGCGGPFRSSSFGQVRCSGARPQNASSSFEYPIRRAADPVI